MATYIGWFFLSLWMADFITGFVHWFEDSYCVRGLPIIGELICDPNLDHHDDPSLMVRTGTFLSRNYIQWSLGAAGALVLAYFESLTPFWALTIFISTFGNEVHRWNHTTRHNSALIEWFKDVGIIQAQRQHSMHHREPFDTNYCTMTSQLNPILDTIKFWRALELFIEAFTYIKPRRLRD